MAGSVRGSVNDWHAGNYHAVSPDINHQGLDSASYKAVRGGGVGDISRYARVAFRVCFEAPETAESLLGFRGAADVAPGS